jgi:branched-chain amino acid transport system substrate-binding protein
VAHAFFRRSFKCDRDLGGRARVDYAGLPWPPGCATVAIDPQTRDIVQNIYLRKVEKLHGELYNVEFATFEAVKGAATATKD